MENRSINDISINITVGILYFSDHIFYEIMYDNENHIYTIIIIIYR